MSKKIMIADGEVSVLTLLEYQLIREGYEVLMAMGGHEALKLAKEEYPDLAILDLHLPGLNGLEVFRRMRRKKITTPILMLVAKEDEINELEIDETAIKPFNAKEIMAQVRSMLMNAIHQKTVNSGEERLTIGELDVYPDRYEAYFRKKKIELTPKEFELLVYLIRHLGIVLSRGELLNAVWHYDFIGDTRIVDVHVGHLREKIEDNTKHPQYIKTLRGFGYKMEAP